MKIINSHYIPLPEPHMLFVSMKNAHIYKHIGTLVVIEEKPGKNGEYGIITHEHPVTSTAWLDLADEEDKDSSLLYYASTSVGGKVLHEIETQQTLQLCPSDKRELPFERFNSILLSHYMEYPIEDFDLRELIVEIDGCGIRMEFPADPCQEIILTSVDYHGKTYLMSDLSGLFFCKHIGAEGDEEFFISEELYHEIQMEFVNQARAYLEIDPSYYFEFTTHREDLQDLVSQLNQDFNDYMVRPDESE